MVAGPAHLPVRRDDHDVTGGHGDFRHAVRAAASARRAAVPRRTDRRRAMIADSPDEVRVRVREQLLQGASQIKLTAGGGVASPQQPARCHHVHRGRAARRRRSWRENWGHLRHRARLHAGRDPACDRRRRRVHRARPPDGRGDRQADRREGRLAEHASRFPTSWPKRFRPARSERAKAQEVFAGTDTDLYELAKKYGIKTAFGTDVLFSRDWRGATTSC